MMTNTTHTKVVTTAIKCTQSRGSAETLITRELIAHQVGGHLALDFCNTTGEHLTERPDELMRDWASFLRWVAQVGLIEPAPYFELLRHPKPLLPIVQLREAIYRVGLAAAGTSRISEHDLALIRENANAAWPEIGLRNNALRWQPTPSHASEQLCAVLAGEALSLSWSLKAARIGICEGGLCGWLFLDEIRAKRRRCAT
jgi:predicted RNA-binding Zn ribbon-like protein